MKKAQLAAQREYSLAGRIGHAMEPVIRPLGYNWKMGVGLLGAFTAREVFVSTMAITYATDAGEGAARHWRSARRDARRSLSPRCAASFGPPRLDASGGREPCWCGLFWRCNA